MANGRDAAAAIGPVDAVVVGLDLEFSYGRLACAAQAIRAGARFIATNRDPVYPSRRA
jgi:ribonucleotide monophosphatase NagD (HAD superfamily)